MIKTLILYESRYGSTWEAANIISLILGPSRRYPLSQFGEGCRDFDFIVIGSPIYNGKVHPKLQTFLDNEREWLDEKNIALFCTCLNGSEGLRVLREVEDNLGGKVLELGVLGGRLEMDRLNDRDYQALKEYISREGLPSQGMDLFNSREVVDLALRLTDIRDGLLDELPVVELKKEVEDFLKQHNTCTLATSSQDSVRATPMEYDYDQGHLYILSEGGMKFAHLLSNSNVSVAVYEDYTDMDNLVGMQITGDAIIVEDPVEYQQVMDMKGLSMDYIRTLPFDLKLIRVDLEKVEFLNSQFEKKGYSERQVLKF
ncbi:flavodoxin domain-containing protein [Methanobacterium formicicum]|uniref:Pyridoxamine 5'-phosphate oxidase-like FMN-binding protein n=1 Tax=Methanobacterium formicicum (strain DSM 3637 / PP1) TaxID=1204725 RepID=K2R939_METFP|nr:flavodoxin domain-containing protein [Methanobacterium formicicum]EKF84804.1 pyridoxamine 5'-phosphate oxidase-like FMN-binding protein [Methanobacterium formicicum DSM 3637]